jgi:uncharacterized membrane protein
VEVAARIEHSMVANSAARRKFLFRQEVARSKPIPDRPHHHCQHAETFPLTAQENLRATAQIARHPIHPMLMPVPIVCFVGALLTDIAYAMTAQMMWANFSAWLLTIGVIMGVLAALAGLFDFLSGRLIRSRAPAWPYVIGNLAALVISFFNALVHTRDAWTSVVPTGLILSAIVVVILAITGWLGRGLVYRQDAGVMK